MRSWVRIDCTKQDLYSKNYLYTESLSYTSDREIMEPYYELYQENKFQPGKNEDII